MATRPWGNYNRAPGGQLDVSNYFYRDTSPTCSTSGPFICTLLGIYDDSSVHPVTFSPRLNSYISLALSHASAQPAGVNKKYVYVRST